MYCAYITTIKEIHKHSNADRLQCATIFGNNVIVDLTYHEGQRVVYFPVDGQLSEEFAKENNLVRTKDENGNNTGGYLDPEKRNIRALKLRGEKSDGLVLPIEVLSKYTDIEQLSDGDQITILDGHEICRKYIPRRNHVRQTNPGVSKTRKGRNKKDDKVAYPFFVEHVDTAQLAYNQSAFREGDTCYITLKMHGCFRKGTPVRMADYSLKPIGKIRVGDYVLGYNFDTNKFVPTKVVNIFKNPPSKKWNEIKISRNGLNGDRRGKIISTYNHPYWCGDQNRWVQAQDLRVGMKVSTVFPTLKLTEQQKEILSGLLLGDGCLLTFHDSVAEVQSGCLMKNEDYLDYLCDISNGLLYRTNLVYNSGYGSEMVRCRTHRCADMYEYFKKFTTLDNKSIRKLKEDLPEYFTPLSMAIFYMDDGSLSHVTSQKDRAYFAICDYGDEDAKIICSCFEKFGIKPVLYKDPRGYNRIRLNTADAYKMFDLIYKFIPPVMRYKLPLEYREKQFDKPIDNEEFVESYIMKSQVVLENNEINTSADEYDLETEFHNYIVGNAIVHNTSARTANAIELSVKKPSLIGRIFGKNDETISQYKTVSGTRRTTLRDFGDGGWYGSNAFREKYHNFFKEKLPKGVEIFYEIVGYVNESTPIMGRCKNKLVKDKDFQRQYGDETVFSYGCEPGQNDCYVYRMTMTNEDGFAVEIPFEQVQILCEKFGVKCVPTFEKFTYTTWEDLMSRVEKYYEGPDPIGKSHIREGVVVRIDNRPSFTAFKHKGWFFKCLEGIIKDTSDSPDMEEAEELGVGG